jgi:c-di-GMP-binding flagellar brake protein YcgR
MFQDTRPAALDDQGRSAPWEDFRVSHPQERQALLRQLRDGSVPVYLSTPEGYNVGSSLWSVDSDSGRLHFSADPHLPQLSALVEADEVTAVAYLDSVKLQFDLDGLMLVRGRDSCTLQTAAPREIYRFQRRGAYRVRTVERYAPRAHFAHPALPDMRLGLRVLDVSIGGCALWLPADVPPLQPGTLVGHAVLELDQDTRFGASLLMQHVTAQGGGEHGAPETGGQHGVRVGCEWHALSEAAERTLQRWIDQAQRRRRMLSLS